MEDNMQAFELFCSMATQWTIISTFSGVHYAGLDYTALQSVFWFENIKKKARKELFESIRLIERGALTTLNKKAK
jgi:hypothetical protein